MTDGRGTISAGVAWYFFWRIHVGFLIIGGIVAFALQPLGDLHGLYVLAVTLLQYMLLWVIVAIVSREALRTNFRGNRFRLSRSERDIDDADLREIEINSATPLRDPVLSAFSIQLWSRIVVGMLLVYELPNHFFGFPGVTDVSAVGISGDMFVYAGFGFAQLICLYCVTWIVVRMVLRHRFAGFEISFGSGSASRPAPGAELSLKGGV